MLMMAISERVSPRNKNSMGKEFAHPTSSCVYLRLMKIFDFQEIRYEEA